VVRGLEACWSASVLSNHLEEGKSLEVLRDTEAVGGEVGESAWYEVLGGMCLVG